MLNKMDKFHIFVPHPLTITSLLIQTSTGMWVQAIGLFAQVTCAPEFGLLRSFNQRLLVLHVDGGAVKQRVKFKTIKFQNKKISFKIKNKKGIWLTVFSRRSCDLIPESLSF